MKEKIGSFQLSSAFILCMVSSSIGLSLHTTIKLAGIDSYISVAIGSLMGILPLLLFLYIFNYKEDLPIYEKTKILFGKMIGTIINLLIVILYVVIGGTVLFNLGNFIVSQYLSETPLLLILLVLGLTIFHIINKGFETITRVSSICVVIAVSFFAFSFAYLIREFNLDNLKPILEFGIKKPIWAGFINMLITLSPVYTLLIFPKNNLVNKDKINRYIIIQYLIASIIIFLVSFLSNGILGKYLISLYQYPGYISLKRISLFGFIDRIENFLSLHWILSSFINLAMIFYYIKGNIMQKKESKIFNLFLCLGIIFVSYKVFCNNTLFNNYTYKVYPYFLGILLFIYLLIGIFIFVRRKRKN